MVKVLGDGDPAIRYSTVNLFCQSDVFLHQNTQVFHKPCQCFYEARALGVKDRKGSYNLRKKYVQEKTQLMCLLLAVIPVVQNLLNATVMQFLARQERTAIQTQVGKERTNKSTIVNVMQEQGMLFLHFSKKNKCSSHFCFTDSSYSPAILRRQFWCLDESPMQSFDKVFSLVFLHLLRYCLTSWLM